jgi:hypothetical protein
MTSCWCIQLAFGKKKASHTLSTPLSQSHVLHYLYVFKYKGFEFGMHGHRRHRELLMYRRNYNKHSMWHSSAFCSASSSTASAILRLSRLFTKPQPVLLQLLCHALMLSRETKSGDFLVWLGWNGGWRSAVCLSKCCKMFL